MLTLNINNPFLKLEFIDIGQGDAILIQESFGRKSILIDTGSKYNYSKLRKSLVNKGIYKINYLVISHNDEDHNGNINNLKNDFIIENILTNGKDIKSKNFELKYLYIDEFDNDNDNSLVYLLKIDDFSVLLTGDISKDAEKILINRYDLHDIDILKVSHHGSKSPTSMQFISSILPKYAVISTNGKYNHPHQETIDVLNAYKSNILITKDSGNIDFLFTKAIDIIKTDKNEFGIIKP